MTLNVDTLIQSVEDVTKQLTKLRDEAGTEGEVGFAADYAVEGLYQFLDVLAPRLPSIKLVADLKSLSEG